MLMNTNEYRESLEGVVSIIAQARQRAVAGVNAEIIRMNWLVGAHINDHAEWGSHYIDTLSKDIRAAFPGIKGFSTRSLKYMAKFAREVDEKLCSSCCTIPWGHIMLLLDKTDPGDRRVWYIQKTQGEGWSRVVLDHQIDLHAYERQVLAGKVNNFDKRLPPLDSELAEQALKDPYIFDFITAEQARTEHDIEEQMVSNVSKLLLELGTGFAFMGRQYHLVVGGDDFYIDLLFYNTNLRRYVVIELKNDAFRPEFTGQLGFYVSAVDGELRGEYDKPTIGLLLCKTKNNVAAEYSLQSTKSPIGISEYRLGDELPDEYKSVLPSPEDLATRLQDPRRDS